MGAEFVAAQYIAILSQVAATILLRIESIVPDSLPVGEQNGAGVDHTTRGCSSRDGSVASYG